MTELRKDMVGFSTCRGVEGYAQVFGMSNEELLGWLGSKRRVLDIGAGGGLLEKEMCLIGLTGEPSSGVTIISFDIAYASQEGVKFLRYATHIAFTRLGVTPSKSLALDVDRSFERDAVGGSSANLPFSDGSFDGVLASYSIGVHTSDKQHLLRSYSELYRVLRKGGEALVSVACSPDAGVFYALGRGGHVNYTLNDLSFCGINMGKSDSNGNFYLRIRKE